MKKCHYIKKNETKYLEQMALLFSVNLVEERTHVVLKAGGKTSVTHTHTYTNTF